MCWPVNCPVQGRNFEEVSAEVFLPPGNHQITVNTKLPPRGPATKKKKKPNYTKLPDDATKIIARESLINAPQIPIDKSIQPPLLGFINKWNATEKGVQRAYEWLRLHGPNGDPRELLRFVRYVNERSEPLDDLKKKITKSWKISPEDFDQKYRNWKP